MANNKIISATEDGIRLSRWVKRHYPKISTGEIHKMCRTGQMRINSSRCKGDEVLRTGNALRIPPFMDSLVVSGGRKPTTENGTRFSLADLEKLRQRIIINDNDFVAFDKPAGLAVQGGTGIKKSLDKMAAALFPYDSILPVHRLDRETSGVIILAKNQRAAQNLSKQFQDKTARKEYLALLNGAVSPRVGRLDNFIVRGRVLDEKEKSAERPQRAITEYQVLGELPNVLSWVRFMPLTGRTHQLRLHAAFSLNAPIVGDSLYNKKEIGEQFLESLLNTKYLFLFAHRLSFTHPKTGKEITISASLPDFMAAPAKFLEFKVE
ncbi:MAG: RluA family pseudouridine synthase [Rickettsiales bacterium]|jgi:23S rRNA pseudouridine955/2504/2580 synthase|nr:RluA family pseudouridine synthase [Rickettsiales bacterium]